MKNELHANSSKKVELTYIQVLRGVAASSVVFAHFGDLPPHSWIKDHGLSQLGTSGVDLFFVISGFIMTYTTHNRNGGRDALRFLFLRARRIYPLYWIWTTALLFLWLAGLALTSHHFQTTFIVSSYTLVPSYAGVTANRFSPLLMQGWTLSFEMFFYLLFALTIFCRMARYRLTFLATLFVLLYIVGKFLPASDGLKYLFTNTIVVEFLFGVLVALLCPLLGKLVRRADLVATFLMCIGVLALFLTTRFRFSVDAMRYLFYGVPAAFIVCGAALMRSRPANKVLLYLGDASYSIYLSHYFIALIFAVALKRLFFLNHIQPDVLIIAMAITTIAVSSRTYPLESIIQRRWSATSM